MAQMQYQVNAKWNRKMTRKRIARERAYCTKRHRRTPRETMRYAIDTCMAKRLGLNMPRQRGAKFITAERLTRAKWWCKLFRHGAAMKRCLRLRIYQQTGHWIGRAISTGTKRRTSRVRRRPTRRRRTRSRARSRSRVRSRSRPTPADVSRIKVRVGSKWVPWSVWAREHIDARNLRDVARHRKRR